MSNFAAATSYRPTLELIHQLFIKFEVTKCTVDGAEIVPGKLERT